MLESNGSRSYSDEFVLRLVVEFTFNRQFEHSRISLPSDLRRLHHGIDLTRKGQGRFAVGVAIQLLLKRGELVTSVKGAQGGYLLSAAPGQITVLDVLTAVETGLFDKTEDTVAEKALEIEFAMRECAFQALDDAVSASLSQVTLEDLVLASEKHKGENAAMYYI